jgi:predicted DNA binding CopG/RHH family protein
MMSKIPKFVSEQEEAEFWAAHDSTEFLDETEAVDVTFIDSRPPKKQIALRLDGETIDALKAVASRKGIGYQTLIRLWVNERLEQEHVSALRS